MDWGFLKQQVLQGLQFLRARAMHLKWNVLFSLLFLSLSVGSRRRIFPEQIARHGVALARFRKWANYRPWWEERSRMEIVKGNDGCKQQVTWSVLNRERGERSKYESRIEISIVMHSHELLDKSRFESAEYVRKKDQTTLQTSSAENTKEVEKLEYAHRNCKKKPPNYTQHVDGQARRGCFSTKHYDIVRKTNALRDTCPTYLSIIIRPCCKYENWPVIQSIQDKII